MVQVVAPPAARDAAAVLPLAAAARQASETLEHADLSRFASTPPRAPANLDSRHQGASQRDAVDFAAMGSTPFADCAHDQGPNPHKANPDKPQPKQPDLSRPDLSQPDLSQPVASQRSFPSPVDTTPPLPQQIASAAGESGFWSLAWGVVGAIAGASFVGALLILIGGGDTSAVPPTKEQPPAPQPSSELPTKGLALDASSGASAAGYNGDDPSPPKPSSPETPRWDAAGAAATVPPSTPTNPSTESAGVAAAQTPPSADPSAVGLRQTSSNDASKSLDVASSPPNNANSVPSPTDVAVADADDSSVSAPVMSADGGQPPVASSDDAEGASDASAAADERVLKIDPLDLDPEGLDMSGLLARPAPPKKNSVPPTDAAASSTGSEAAEDRIAPPVPEPPGGLNGESLDDDFLSGPHLAKSPVLVDPSGAPAGVPPDIDRQLAQPLTKIAVSDMPLGQFLSLITQISGVPTSVAPEELRLAGIDWTRKMSVERSETTVGELLESALGPLKLGVDATASQAIIRRQKLAAQREIVYPVSDLLRGPLTEETLAAWVRQLVAPESWPAGAEIQTDKNQGSLRVVQSERIQYELLFFLERWRTARGLPTKSRYPVDRLPDEAPELAAMAKLAVPTTFTISEFTSLQEVFAFWQQELGITVLVDWPALQSADLWPQSKIACRAKEQPWSQALNEILNPLGLSWRALDEQTLQISSANQLNSRPELAFYRLSPAKRGDQASWQAQLDAWAVQAGIGETPGTGVALDAASGLLLVRHVPAVQRLVAAALASP